MPIHAQFYRPVIWTRKVGQGDLAFDVRLGFAGVGVCACNSRSLCVQQLGLVPPYGCPKI